MKGYKNLTNNSHMDSRPTFYYKNNKKNPIRAGGVLFYRFFPDFEMLLINPNNKIRYEDFGGKTDEQDKNILETIAREVYEESNGIFSQKWTINELEYATNIYIKQSKYLLYFVNITNLENVYKKDFGEKEFHENIKRTVEWVKVPEKNINILLGKTLSFRLTNKQTYDNLKRLQMLRKTAILIKKIYNSSIINKIPYKNENMKSKT